MKVPEHLRPRLDRVAHDIPEWRGWLDLLRATAAAVSDPAWDRVHTHLDPGRPEPAPILTRAEIALAPALAERWVRRLVETASRGGGAARSLNAAGLDPLEFLEAALGQDAEAVARLGRAAGGAPDALVAVAGLAATPLLQACGRRFRRQVPAGWAGGYCPICGSWPAFGEIRGIERALWLRCARCGAEWRRWQGRCCVYCLEAGHERLGVLVSEAHAGARKIETCASCRGYLKTVTVLEPAPADGIALEDLDTIDLDLVALERGYARPSGPGCALRARLVGARPHTLRAGWRRVWRRP